jgi:hypothetical protein
LASPVDSPGFRPKFDKGVAIFDINLLKNRIDDECLLASYVYQNPRGNLTGNEENEGFQETVD